jgi:hypothetical protein
MYVNLSAKAVLSPALAAAASLLFSQAAFALDHTGKIVLYHLNATIPNRGACIQMTPPLPNTWACVDQGNLYNELNTLLRQGYVAGTSCTAYWSGNDPSGNPKIDIAQCQ